MAESVQGRPSAQAHEQLDIAGYDYDAVISSVVSHKVANSLTLQLTVEILSQVNL